MAEGNVHACDRGQGQANLLCFSKQWPQNHDSLNHEGFWALPNSWGQNLRSFLRCLRVADKNHMWLDAVKGLLWSWQTFEHFKGKREQKEKQSEIWWLLIETMSLMIIDKHPKNICEMIWDKLLWDDMWDVLFVDYASRNHGWKSRSKQTHLSDAVERIFHHWTQGWTENPSHSAQGYGAGELITRPCSLLHSPVCDLSHSLTLFPIFTDILTTQTTHTNTHTLQNTNNTHTHKLHSTHHTHLKAMMGGCRVD